MTACRGEHAHSYSSETIQTQGTYRLLEKKGEKKHENSLYSRVHQ